MNTLKSALKWVIAILLICLAAYFLANINGLTVSRNMGEVDGVKITQEEYRFYLEMEKSAMLAENGVADQEAEKAFWDSEIDGKKASDIAKENAKNEMLRVLVACKKAEEAGISLTEEEKSSAKSILNSDSATKEQVKELEKATGADRYQLVAYMEKQLLANAYAESLAAQENSPLAVTEDEKLAAVKEKYARVKHVLIQNTPQTGVTIDENGNQVPAAEPTAEETASYLEEAKKKAEDVLKKATSGADFDGLIKEFGEDPGMESASDGYIIDENGTTIDGSGSMVPEFTKGSFAAKAGEVNPQLVESAYGWHIIKRYSIDPSAESYAQILATAESTLMGEKYEAYIDEFVKNANITINEKVYGRIKVK